MRLLPNLKTLFVVTAVVAGIASRLEAASIVTVPTGLAPGSQYRLVFVTNSAYQLQSTSISTYNNDVATEAAAIAQLAALGATWYAIASTDADSAASNIGASASTVGIYLLDGATLVANGTGTAGSGLFSGRLLAPINLTELGTAPFTDTIWTGSNADGTSNASGNALAPLRHVITGITSYYTFGGWIDFGTGGAQAQPFYGISSVLTVPGAAAVPEPATTALAALGLASLFAALRLRKQRNLLANPTDR